MTDVIEVKLTQTETGHILTLDAARSQQVVDEITNVTPNILIRLLNAWIPRQQDLPVIAPDMTVEVRNNGRTTHYEVFSRSVLRRIGWNTSMQFHFADVLNEWISRDLP